MIKDIRNITIGLLLGVGSLYAIAAVSVPNTFTAGTPIKSADVNANFSALQTGVNALETSLNSKLSSVNANSSLTGNGTVATPLGVANNAITAAMLKTLSAPTGTKFLSFNGAELAWADGSSGTAGPQGPQGIQGVKGDTGIQGLAGAAGLKGDTGATGPAGAGVSFGQTLSGSSGNGLTINNTGTTATDKGLVVNSSGTEGINVAATGAFATAITVNGNGGGIDATGGLVGIKGKSSAVGVIGDGGAFGVLASSQDVGVSSTGNNVAVKASSPTVALELDGPIKVSGSNKTIFEHYVSADGVMSCIDNPLTNNDPNAFLIITHKWTGARYSVPFFVWYEATIAKKWCIASEDGAQIILSNTRFNVLVIKQ